MTEITLYNTATRRKEPLEPTVVPGRVSMYVCGPTVYDRAHIGNARPVVVFDVLYRLLRHVYGAERVTYVRNITDVDDKINARAAETGRPIREITEETVAWYREDMAALGALPPSHEPRATEYVPQMVAMIETLVAKGHAYAAEGHVLFSVASYPAYGRFARRSLDEMRAGARVEVAPYKRDPMDFVLWKPSDPGLPGWDSPWGRGRPGWHIECSAMSHALLGPSFDIHGGGIDLVFPHHENEIAQSRCAHPGAEFARVWMHNGFVNIESEKMSKSLGNFFTVRDVLQAFNSEFAIDNAGPAIRLRLLQSHYREPLNWTKDTLQAAASKLDTWSHFVDRSSSSALTVSERVQLLEGTDFLSALADDLNTPQAITEIDKLIRASIPSSGMTGEAGSRSLDAMDSGSRRVRAAVELLGFTAEALRGMRHDVWSERLRNRAAALHAGVHQLIEELIAARAEARRQRNFERADALRDGFAAAGLVVKDMPDGVRWELAPGFDPSKLEALR